MPADVLPFEHADAQEQDVDALLPLGCPGLKAQVEQRPLHDRAVTVGQQHARGIRAVLVQTDLQFFAQVHQAIEDGRTAGPAQAEHTS